MTTRHGLGWALLGLVLMLVTFLAQIVVAPLVGAVTAGAIANLVLWVGVLLVVGGLGVAAVSLIRSRQ